MVILLTIYICIGSACHLKGSHEVIEGLKKQISNHKLNDKICISAAFCLGHCTEAVSVKFEDKIYSVNPSTVDAFFETQILRRF